MEYYVFKTRTEADACVKYLNVDKGWYPIVGNVKGIPAPQNQQTLRWVEGPIEMKDGSFAVPKLPEQAFDHMKVPVTAEDKADLLVEHGKDIRELSAADFPEPKDDVEPVVVVAAIKK